MKQKRLLLMFMLVGVVAMATTACGEPDDPYVPEWNDKWDPENPNPDEPNPDEPTPEPEKPTLKPRYIWIDAAANFHDYANNNAKIESDMAKVAGTGFTDIVVDIRPTMGDVLYRTTHTAQVEKLGSWRGGGGYHWEKRTATWDYLEAFIKAGHKAGLRVHAGFNTMVAGNAGSYGLEAQGIAYRDSNKRDWVTVLNTADGLQNMMDVSSYGTKFFNPAHPEVVEFVCNLLKDLAAYEELDGIILDRCRYDDLMCDFSATSREQFEKHIGRNIVNWPNEVMAPGSKALPAMLGSTQLKWLEFRVKTIHDFIVKAREAVKSVNPDISFGAYVGGWYSTYYDVGVNWASPKYNTAASYKWATTDYKNYGFADHLDVLLIGAYASTSSIYGGGEWSVQGFCKLAHSKVMGDCVVVGGPDVGNGTGWTNGNVPTKATESVDAAINSCDGYFLFDLIHVKMYSYWDALKQGINNYLREAQN
ncbi:MAG: family 10 glycosylhydrolase [Tidjanibacter sp.]|nr:family 10 glycosylhydrolase [Tidjanibacter sp.]